MPLRMHHAWRWGAVVTEGLNADNMYCLLEWQKTFFVCRIKISFIGESHIFKCGNKRTQVRTNTGSYLELAIVRKPVTINCVWQRLKGKQGREKALLMKN